MLVKLKYGAKIAGRFYPKGYPVKLLTEKEIKELGLKYSEDSTAVAVKFPELDNHTLISEKEIDIQ